MPTSDPLPTTDTSSSICTLSSSSAVSESSASTHTTSLTSSSFSVVVTSRYHSAWPNDIAQNSQQGPVQPKGFKYPSSVFGSVRRSFTCNWFEKYCWLEYSILKDAAFCFPSNSLPLFLLNLAKVEQKRLSFLSGIEIGSMLRAKGGSWKSTIAVTHIVKQ